MQTSTRTGAFGPNRCFRHYPRPPKSHAFPLSPLFHVKSPVNASLPGFRSWKYGLRGHPDAANGSIVSVTQRQDSPRNGD